MTYSRADVHVPKYRRVFETIKTDILSGRYQAGQKLPSEAALLKRFGISRITAGRALRELQQAGLIQRRAGSGTYTEHLLKLGCRRIAFAAYSDSASTVEARIAGYREALFVAGGSIEPTLVQRLETGDESEVRRMMEKLKPEAIIGANDRTAGQLMQSLIRLNYQVPKDVRIAGIDDVGYANLLPVPLTTVHQPCREIGVAAVDAMLERVATPEMPVRDILLDCKLIIRDSCGASLSRKAVAT
jgi:GntR family transcriptional regulator, arabinose operon transcriptional repressor